MVGPTRCDVTPTRSREPSTRSRQATIDEDTGRSVFILNSSIRIINDLFCSLFGVLAGSDMLGGSIMSRYAVISVSRQP